MISRLTHPIIGLSYREVVRFFRQTNRLIGAFATPIIFWAVIGSGMGNSFRPPGADVGMSYLEYFFPGIMLMMILFTSIFSTVSVITDRTEGYMQTILVSPIHPLGIVLSKVFAGVIECSVPCLGFSLVWFFFGYGMPHPFLLIFSILLISTLATGLGFILAWPMKSPHGFHAIINLVLMPLWMLSGAVFSPSSAYIWLRPVLYLNPFTYGLATLRYALYPSGATLTAQLPGCGISLLVLEGSSALLLLLAATITTRSSRS